MSLVRSDHLSSCCQAWCYFEPEGCGDVRVSRKCYLTRPLAKGSRSIICHAGLKVMILGIMWLVLSKADRHVKSFEGELRMLKAVKRVPA